MGVAVASPHSSAAPLRGMADEIRNGRGVSYRSRAAPEERARDQQLAHRFGLVLPGERVRRQVHQRLEHKVDRDDGAHQLLDQLLGDSSDSWLGRGHEGLRPGAGKLSPLAARDPLLDLSPGYAAAELDRDPGHLCDEREAIVGTLIFAGPRAYEIAYMLERDIDLANTRIFVGRSKTAAGLRELRTASLLRSLDIRQPALWVLAITATLVAVRQVG